MKTAIFNFLVISLLTIAVAGCSSNATLQPSSPRLSSPRYGHAVVNDGDKIYVLGGANKSGFLSTIEIIDPTTEQVEIIKTNLIPRRFFSAVWDGKSSIYLIGGTSTIAKNARPENRVEIFNTVTHEISVAKPLPLPTRINTAVLLDDKIYVFGGMYTDQRALFPIAPHMAAVSVYDIANDSWQRLANMPTAKSTRAIAKDGFIYVVGGYDGRSALNVFERFNPSSNHWESLPPMPTNISAHSIALLHNKLYVFGSYDDLTSTYCYDFDSKQWQKISIGYQASRHNGATTLAERMYVIGGNVDGSGDALDYIQIFQP